jgi:hypothetical protein
MKNRFLNALLSDLTENDSSAVASSLSSSTALHKLLLKIQKRFCLLNDFAGQNPLAYSAERSEH